MKKRKSSSESRAAGLHELLDGRRKELTADLADSMRRMRTAADNARVAEPQDGSHRELPDDLDMALVQMKSEMLARIEGAIRRLEAGTYGNCAECDQPIPTARLRALPFAIRCAPCEAARETSSTRRTAGMTRAYPNVGGVAD